MGAISEQVDLFLDSLINAPVKDDQALMQFPFFSLQKQPRMEPMVFERDGIVVRITPGPKGIATIWDKDVLMYLASSINDRIERNLPVDRTVRFHAYDLLRVTRRAGNRASKKDYEALKDALFRLRSTTIETTIKSADSREERGFGWIDNWRIVRRDAKAGEEEGAMAAVEVTLNDWMFRAIVRDRRVLTINPNYFSLTKGLERRLYELARKHCGHQRRWDISLEKLIEKCGSTRELRFFKRDLKTIIEMDTLPDYSISMSFDPAERKEVEAAGMDGRRWSSNERIIVSFHRRGKVGTDYIDHEAVDRM
jgi:plasmid replication initiation protein